MQEPGAARSVAAARRMRLERAALLRAILIASATLGLVALLTSCTRLDRALSPTDRVPLGADRFQLRIAPDAFDIPTAMVPAEMSRAALDVCPRGYERERDWSTRIEGSSTYVWEVRCLG